MGIENLRWWHWTLLSLGIGWLLAYMNTATVEPTGMRTDQVTAFELAVLHPPVGDQHIPWLRNLVVYPRTQADGPNGQRVTVMPITYEVLMPKPGGAPNEYEYESTWFGGRVPYLPSYDRRLIREGGLPDPAAGATDLPPGIEKSYVPDPDATLAAITTAVYGQNTAEGRDAISLANTPLRVLRPGDAIKALFASGRIRAGQPLLIPWNPAKRMTVRDWLDTAAKDHAWIHYRFAWWKVPKYANEAWIGASVALVGVVWPALISVMSGAGLGRRGAAGEEYDLSRYGRKSKSKAVKAASADVSQDHLDQLAMMNQVLTATLHEGLEKTEKTAAPDPAAAPAPAPKPFMPPPPDTAAPAIPMTEAEKKEYTGEFYPVAHPTTKPPDKKPPQGGATH